MKSETNIHHDKYVVLYGVIMFSFLLVTIFTVGLQKSNDNYVADDMKIVKHVISISNSQSKE